jgi:hypothetical protein
LKLKNILHWLIETPICCLVRDPRVRWNNRIENWIVLHEGVGVVDQTLGNLRDLGSTCREVVLQKLVLKRSKNYE